MDLLTQAVVGAVAGGASGRLTQGPGRQSDHAGGLRAAALTGALAALLADADVLLGNPSDPIVAQELHRHFTHALLFVPIGAALVTALLARPLRRHLRAVPRFAAAAAGLLTAGLLDACTGFGTHLLWPFSDARIALNLVSIIDPLFTLLALVPLLIALRSGRRGALHLALALLVGYLLLAALQQQRALDAGAMAAAARDERPQRMLVRPSFGNILLWRSIYLADGEWQADAVRAGLFEVCVRPGARAPALLLRVAGAGGREPVRPARATAPAPEWLPADALRRLSILTDDVMVIDGGGQRIGDARFAMLPDSMTPIWGLRAAGPPPGAAASGDSQSDASVEWFTDRTLTPPMRARFLSLLRGDDPACRKR